MAGVAVGGESYRRASRCRRVLREASRHERVGSNGRDAGDVSSERKGTVEQGVVSG